jgi:hypothetical protein
LDSELKGIAPLGVADPQVGRRRRNGAAAWSNDKTLAKIKYVREKIIARIFRLCCERSSMGRSTINPAPQVGVCPIGLARAASRLKALKV